MSAALFRKCRDGSVTRREHLVRDQLMYRLRSVSNFYENELGNAVPFLLDPLFHFLFQEEPLFAWKLSHEH